MDLSIGFVDVDSNETHINIESVFCEYLYSCYERRSRDATFIYALQTDANEFMRNRSGKKTAETEKMPETEQKNAALK